MIYLIHMEIKKGFLNQGLFFQNPIMDLIGEDEKSVYQFFENNSEENVEMLFATSKSYKAYVNELIIYELNY